MQIQIYVYEDVGVIISNEGLEVTYQHLGKTDSDAVKEAFGAFWDILNEKATD